ncbi:nucleotide-diphospho-sugar transferase [Dichotomocladium elegans]|nr:nucleotide-diphospho-sugar transferase [Dichotomocladium elegans]
MNDPDEKYEKENNTSGQKRWLLSGGATTVKRSTVACAIALATGVLTLCWFFYYRPSLNVYPNKIDWSGLPVRGAFVIVGREEELFSIRETMRDVEDRFNEAHGYPWVIISEQPFSERFQELVGGLASGRVYFGEAQTWHEPPYIDIKRAEITAKEMGAQGIYHGESISWRKMARYNVGFLADHPLLQDAEYYWKVQPRSRYLCDIKEDPFLFMKTHGKKLAFAISMVENGATIPSLWPVTQAFMGYYSSLIRPSSESIMPWLLNAQGAFNGNHIWNNFMIMSLDFMRSEGYRAYFEYLDRSGGFFYERWSDAPVQTFAAAMFMGRNEVHYMEDLGYYYSVATNCPVNKTTAGDLRCVCSPEKSFCK